MEMIHFLFKESMVLQSIEMGPNLPFVSNISLVNISNCGAVVCFFTFNYNQMNHLRSLIVKNAFDRTLIWIWSMREGFP